MTVPVRSAKSELRRAIQSSLNALSEEEITRQSRKIHEALFSLPEYRSATSLSVYLSMPTREVTTKPIVLRSIEHGKKVFVPYLYRGQGKEPTLTLMDMVTLHSKDDYDNFPPDKWGIPTPPKDSVSKRLRCLGSHDEEVAEKRERFNGMDVIVMPGVAFDKSFQRLGHGKGFYDIFLEQYRERSGLGGKMPFLVGLALQQQLLPQGQEVPVTSTDWQLDALIVGDGSVHRLLAS